MNESSKNTSKPLIMTDFDTTLIIQNSLNILSKKVFRYYLKKKRLGNLIKKIPIFITRLKEVYTNKLVPDLFLFDDTDTVIKKAKMLKGIPYFLYLEKTLPELDINPFWLEQCLRARKKHKIDPKLPITIVSRNGEQEIKDFLEFENNENNIELLNNKNLINKLSLITGKKINPKKLLKKKLIKNKEIFEILDISFKIKANKLCKKLVIIDNKKTQMYTGIIKKTSDIGVIERKNKAILYENNIVLADNEENMYKTWAKEFVNVQVK